LRFYVYISDAKVEMLMAQIPPRALKRIGAELSINLKVLSVKFTERESLDSRYSRAAAVTQYLTAQGLVSEVNDSSMYFAVERAPMRWAHVGNPGLVFFAGEIEGSVVFLTGSPHHVIGAAPRAVIDPRPPASHTILPLDAYWDVFDDWNEPAEIGGSRPADLAGSFHKGLFRESPHTPATESLSFLARRMLRHEDSTRQRTIVLGSPVWVAVNDPAPVQGSPE